MTPGGGPQSPAGRAGPARGTRRGEIIVTFDGTFMQRANGAHSRAEAMLRFLADRFERVILYSTREHPTCPWTSRDIERFAADHPGVTLVLEQRSRLLRALTRVKLVAAALAPGLARPLLALGLPAVAPAYDSMLRRHPGAALFVNYLDGLAQLNGMRDRSVVVETHDIRFVNHRLQLHAPAHSLKSVLNFRSEVALLDLVRAVVAISPTEAGIYRMLLDRAEVLYIPDLPEACGHPMEDVSDEGAMTYDLVFFGSDNILNVEGLTRFLDEHAPWLAGRRLAVCGTVCGKASVIQTALRHPGVTLLGFVPDMDAVYRQSKAAVAPVAGTGLKIKIVDALRCGKPVFASASARAGLPPGFEGCVFPIEPMAMDAILDAPERRRLAERRSRAYAAAFSQTGQHEALVSILAEGSRLASRRGAVPPSLGSSVPLSDGWRG